MREQRLGVAFEDAIDHLAQRVPSQDVQLVSSALRISREVGGNLADTVARLGDTIRKRLMMEQKICMNLSVYARCRRYWWGRLQTCIRPVSGRLPWPRWVIRASSPHQSDGFYSSPYLLQVLWMPVRPVPPSFVIWQSLKSALPLDH